MSMLPYGYEYAVSSRVKDPKRGKVHIIRVIERDGVFVARYGRVAYCGVHCRPGLGREAVKRLCERCQKEWERETAHDRIALARLVERLP